jgi:hypothetical protein
LGMLVSRKRRGSCHALRWDDDQNRYLCGLISDPQSVLPLPYLWMRSWIQHLALRWVASGVGCDASLDVGQVTPNSSDRQ